MTLKEHPFVVTTSIPHDNSTIMYDITKKHRSDAVGKVYKINDDGKAELPGEDEEFDGVIIAVDDTHITAAYMFGGLRAPLAKDSNGDAVTVARGDKLVAGVDASNSDAKGYVKAGGSDLSDIAAAPTQTDHNAVRGALNALRKEKGSVIDFDTTHALIAYPG